MLAWLARNKSLEGNLFSGQKLSFSDQCPSRKKEADTDFFILQLMDGITPLEEIARRTFEKYSNHFISTEKAFEYVYQLTEDYAHWKENG